MQQQSYLTQLAEARSKPLTIDNSYIERLEQIHKHGLEFVEHIINLCTGFASKGFGSAKLTIDKSFDDTGVPEGCGSDYSHDFVVQRLYSAKFKMRPLVAHSDAVTYLLIWDENYPQAKEKIGMRYFKPS